MNRLMTAAVAALALLVTACGSRGGGDSTVADSSTRQAPVFDTDSAMSYLKAQTSLGPRVPGTEAHRQCALMLHDRLQQLGADTVIDHNVTVQAWNGDQLPLTNILARFGSNASLQPILLVAHWDSRPWADGESDSSRASQPIDGANDGASGVAVLLEIARQAGINGTLAPIDILLVDGEDYGSHDDHGEETSWCLGTQEWLKTNPYINRLKPRYAILLDMVGGQGARFNREYISDVYAPEVVDMVWQAAAELGLADRFVNSRGGAVVDDHMFLNHAGIPAIDIIESMNPATGSFNPTWHTLDDNYDNIDPSAITDTGRVVSRLTIKQPSK